MNSTPVPLFEVRCFLNVRHFSKQMTTHAFLMCVLLFQTQSTLWDARCSTNWAPPIYIHQQPSTPIIIHQQPSTSINIHQRPLKSINAQQHRTTPSVKIHQHSTTSINIHQHSATSFNIHRHPSESLKRLRSSIIVRPPCNSIQRYPTPFISTHQHLSISTVAIIHQCPSRNVRTQLLARSRSAMRPSIWKCARWRCAFVIRRPHCQ